MVYTLSSPVLLCRYFTCIKLAIIVHMTWPSYRHHCQAKLATDHSESVDRNANVTVGGVSGPELLHCNTTEGGNSSLFLWLMATTLIFPRWNGDVWPR